MKITHKLIAVCFTMLFTGTVYAAVNSSDLITIADASDSQDSVLTPGAKLIAGDPSKNEFYILGKEEAQTSIMVADNQSQSESTQNLSKALSRVMAIQQPKIVAMRHAKEHHSTKLVAKKAEKKVVAAKKVKASTKVIASKKAMTKPAIKVVAHKKSITKTADKIKLALKKSHNKLASKKLNSKIKVAATKHRKAKQV